MREEDITITLHDNIAVQPVQKIGDGQAANACIAIATGFMIRVAGINLGYGAWDQGEEAEEGEEGEGEDTRGWKELATTSWAGNPCPPNRIQVIFASFLCKYVQLWVAAAMNGEEEEAEDIIADFTRATSPDFYVRHEKAQARACVDQDHLPSLIQFMVLAIEAYASTAPFWSTAEEAADAESMARAWYTWLENHPRNLSSSAAWTNMLQYASQEEDGEEEVTTSAILDFLRLARAQVVNRDGELTSRARTHLSKISEDGGMRDMVREFMHAWPFAIELGAEREGSGSMGTVDALHPAPHELPTPHCIPYDTQYRATISTTYTLSLEELTTLSRPGCVAMITGMGTAVDAGIPLVTSSQEGGVATPPLGPQVLAAALSALRKHGGRGGKGKASDERVRAALTHWLPNLVDSAISSGERPLPAVTGHTELGTLLGSTLLEGVDEPTRLEVGADTEPLVSGLTKKHAGAARYGPRVVKEWPATAVPLLPGYLSPTGPDKEGCSEPLQFVSGHGVEGYEDVVHEITVMLTHIDAWMHASEEEDKEYLILRAVSWESDAAPIVLGKWHIGSGKLFALPPGHKAIQNVHVETQWQPVLNNLHLFLPHTAQLAMGLGEPSPAWYTARRALCRMLHSAGCAPGSAPFQTLQPLLSLDPTPSRFQILPPAIELPGSRIQPLHIQDPDTGLAGSSATLNEALPSLPPWACATGKTRDAQEYRAYVQLASSQERKGNRGKAGTIRLSAVYEVPHYKPWKRPVKFKATITEHSHRDVHVSVQSQSFTPWHLRLAYVLGGPEIRALFRKAST